MPHMHPFLGLAVRRTVSWSLLSLPSKHKGVRKWFAAGQREREREIYIYVYVYVYTYIHICKCVNVYNTVRFCMLVKNIYVYIEYVYTDSIKI